MLPRLPPPPLAAFYALGKWQKSLCKLRSALGLQGGEPSRASLNSTMWLCSDKMESFNRPKVYRATHSKALDNAMYI